MSYKSSPTSIHLFRTRAPIRSLGTFNFTTVVVAAPVAFLRQKPLLHAGSPVQHLTADACSWGPYAKGVPSVERALVTSQFDGKCFGRQKFCEERFSARHVIS
jgi:hypothetical protein